MKRLIELGATLALVLGAQQAPEDAAGVGQRWKQNAEALHSYTYKRRTEFTLKGQTYGGRVDQVRWVDGKMEATPLEKPRLAESSRGRGLRGKMVQGKIEKKKEEMKERVQEMQAMMQHAAGGDAVRKALENATISRVGSGPNADLKIVATGMAKPKDSFTLIWSVANQRPGRSEIRTEMEGNPVTITMEYGSLPDGTFYPAKTLINAPKKDMTIKIDTYDYVRVGGKE